MNLIFFIALALPAEIVGTFVGFGATTLLVPTASLFLPIKEAIVLAGLFHMFGTLWRSIYFRKGINWRMVFLFGVPSLIFAAVGSFILSFSSPSAIAKLLGLFLIAYGLVSLSGYQFSLPKVNLAPIIGGALVGFLAGLIGTGGAIRGAFLSSWNIKKELYLGTGAAIGLGADITKVLTYHQTGLLKVTPEVILLFAIISFIGTTIGRIFVKRTGQKIFKKIILIALILAGAKFFLT